MAHPYDKVITDANGVLTANSETQAEIHLSHLSVDVLRDLARNEAASKEWRKAAVELLMAKNHRHQNHPELRQLVFEIRAEQEARKEVESLAAQSPETEQVIASVPLAEPNEEIEVELHPAFKEDIFREE